MQAATYSVLTARRSPADRDRSCSDMFNLTNLACYSRVPVALASIRHVPFCSEKQIEVWSAGCNSFHSSNAHLRIAWTKIKEGGRNTRANSIYACIAREEYADNPCTCSHWPCQGRHNRHSNDLPIVGACETIQGVHRPRPHSRRSYSFYVMPSQSHSDGVQLAFGCRVAAAEIFQHGFDCDENG